MRNLLIQLTGAAVLALTSVHPMSAQAAVDAPALSQDAPIMLNEHVIITENVIRLGDLFTNAGSNAEAAVAYAPELGKQAIFDARWLYRVANAYKLQWRPLGNMVRATVERDSIIIPKDDIKAEVLFALAEQGVEGDMDIDFQTRFQQIYLPAGSDPSVKVESIDYQPRTGRFSAIVNAGSSAGSERMRLNGRVFRTVDVPVLAGRVLRGDVITKRDIAWIRMNADRVQRDAIMDAEDLIGKAPTRGIRAGTPVRSNDVRHPVLVKKNSLVTIIHRVPNMMLTAQGKSLDDGADGDVIRIRNERSNQVIEGEVVGSGRVAVRSIAHEISMNVN